MGKVMTAVIYVLLVLVLIVSGILVLPAYQKYKRTKQEWVSLQADLDRVKAEYLRDG